jgi:hypothetical protein
MIKQQPKPTDEPAKATPPPTPALPKAPEAPPAHPAHHRHQHAVIHPANGDVTHTDPGGTIHIG